MQKKNYSKNWGWKREFNKLWEALNAVVEVWTLFSALEGWHLMFAWYFLLMPLCVCVCVHSYVTKSLTWLSTHTHTKEKIENIKLPQCANLLKHWADPVGPFQCSFSWASPFPFTLNVPALPYSDLSASYPLIHDAAQIVSSSWSHAWVLLSLLARVSGFCFSVLSLPMHQFSWVMAIWVHILLLLFDYASKILDIFIISQYPFWSLQFFLAHAKELTASSYTTHLTYGVLIWVKLPWLVCFIFIREMFFRGSLSPKTVSNISSSLCRYRFPHISGPGATSNLQPWAGLVDWLWPRECNGNNKSRTSKPSIRNPYYKAKGQGCLWPPQLVPSWQSTVTVRHMGESHWTFQSNQQPTQTREEEAEPKPMQLTLVNPRIVKRNKRVVVLNHRVWV